MVAELMPPLVPNIETSKTLLEYQDDITSRINAKKYDSAFYDVLEKQGFGDYVRAYQDCLKYWVVTKCKNGCENYYSRPKPCKKKGCPVCSSKSRIEIIEKFSRLLDPVRPKRVFKFSWLNSLTKLSYEQRYNNLRALVKRLERYGYVVTSMFGVWETEESSNGMHLHKHQVISGYVDLKKRVQEPLVYECYNRKSGAYLGSHSIFSHHLDGFTSKKRIQLDGYLNIYALSQIWEEITGNSYIVYAQSVRDKTGKKKAEFTSPEAIGYLSKYLSKPYKWRNPNNLCLYLREFKNKKKYTTLSYDNKNPSDYKIKIKKFCGICGSRFSRVPLEKSSYGIVGQTNVITKYYLNDDDELFIYPSEMRFRIDQEILTRLEIEKKQTTYLEEKQLNQYLDYIREKPMISEEWQLLCHLNDKQYDYLKEIGVIFENRRGYVQCL